MSAVRFYVDEHVSRAVVRALRVRGADVQTVAEAGLLGATDTEHLAYAAQEGRVLFTQDDDFLRLAASHAHAGIVYVPQRMSVGAVVRGLVLIYSVLDAEAHRVPLTGLCGQVDQNEAVDPPEVGDVVSALVTDEMQRALPLDVPIVVGLGAAPNWLDAH